MEFVMYLLQDKIKLLTGKWIKVFSRYSYLHNLEVKVKKKLRVKV